MPAYFLQIVNWPFNKLKILCMPMIGLKASFWLMFNNTRCCDVLSMFVLSKWQFWNLFGAPDGRWRSSVHALSYWYLFCDPRRWDNNIKVPAQRRVSASGALGRNKHGHNNSAPKQNSKYKVSTYGMNLIFTFNENFANTCKLLRSFVFVIITIFVEILQNF